MFFYDFWFLFQNVLHRRIHTKSNRFFTPIALLGLGASTQQIKMTAENSALDDLLQNADQLFDENQYQEALDVLKKYSVRKF